MSIDGGQASVRSGELDPAVGMFVVRRNARPRRPSASPLPRRGVPDPTDIATWHQLVERCRLAYTTQHPQRGLSVAAFWLPARLAMSNRVIWCAVRYGARQYCRLQVKTLKLTSHLVEAAPRLLAHVTEHFSLIPLHAANQGGLRPPNTRLLFHARRTRRPSGDFQDPRYLRCHRIDCSSQP